MILNIHKPIGWTSFDVVKKIRWIIKEKKVGHGGTLDPFAEGVLIIGTGQDTKKLTSITTEDKSYTAIIKLGEITNTLDTEGEIIETQLVPELSLVTIENVLNSFLGSSFQIPPMFSAKKVNGQRLYKLARKNVEVEREPSSINIFEIELNDFISPLLSFRVKCSKGTYIRVLGSDIAEKLGTVGHLIALKRVKVGDYTLNETIRINELEKNGCFNKA